MNQQGNEGHISCECKPGFAPAFTNDGVLDCKCNPGYTYEAGKCTMCPPGTYKKEIGNGACSSCDKTAVRGSFSTMSSIMSATTSEIGKVGPPTSPLNCTCEKGDFLLEGKPSAEPDFVGHGYCSRCPEGTNCVERGVTLESLPLKPSYWRSSQKSYNVVPCKVDVACSQSDVTVSKLDTQCAIGHSGPLCNVCEKGFSKSMMGVCEACTDSIDLPLEGLAVVFGCVVVSFVLYRWFRRKREKIIEKVLGEDDEHDFKRSMKTKFKIMATFFQMISSFEVVLDIRFPKVFETFTRQLSSLVNLDMIQLGRIGCLTDTNYYTTLLGR